MKIPLNLVLPDPTVHKRLTKRLETQIKPFLTAVIVICAIFTVFMWAGTIFNKRWDPVALGRDIVFTVCGALITLSCWMGIKWPNEGMKIILLVRLLLTVFLCYVQYRLDCMTDITNEPVSKQIKHFKTFFNFRQVIINFYIQINIFMTPFAE